ncbi:MAG: ABC transporter permease [Eubacteriales bacterium]|nr:ABC transporter permease [Eubacteriales bacterium]
MGRYILKRILTLIPVLLGVTLLVFLILSLAPGDPAKTILGEMATPEAIEQLREEMGLNDPILVQYGRYMGNLIRGDFGISYKTKVGVVEEIGARFPTTMKVAFSAIIIAIVLAIPLGIVAAVKQNTLVDGLSMFIALLGVSIPIFWFSMLLIQLFSVKLGWFPVQGTGTWKHYVLPGLALGFQSMASIARITRSSMLEVIRQDYITTARAKGLPQGRVIRHHALPNALIPTITVTGLQIGSLLAGAVMTETVFGLPGIGRYMVQSIEGRDTPAIMGCIIVFTVVFTLVNLIVDLLYGLVDPRIRAQYKK